MDRGSAIKQKQHRSRMEAFALEKGTPASGRLLWHDAGQQEAPVSTPLRALRRSLGQDEDFIYAGLQASVGKTAEQNLPPDKPLHISTQRRSP